MSQGLLCPCRQKYCQMSELRFSLPLLKIKMIGISIIYLNPLCLFNIFTRKEMVLWCVAVALCDCDQLSGLQPPQNKHQGFSCFKASKTEIISLMEETGQVILAQTRHMSLFLYVWEFQHKFRIHTLHSFCNASSKKNKCTKFK